MKFAVPLTDLKQDPDMQVGGPSHHFFLQSHFELRQIGRGSNGEVFLAIRKNDAQRAWDAYDDHGSRDQLIAELRERLVVAKFVLPGGSAQDIGMEIQFLSHEPFFTSQDAEKFITPLISHETSFSQHRPRWLTMPYIPGGDLRTLVKKCWRDLSISLQWHIALATTRSLLWFHFGIDDTSGMQPAPEWPTCYFADLHTGNLLLKPDNSPENGGFPSIRLADFGRARRVYNSSGLLSLSEYFPLTKANEQREFKQKRQQDWCHLGHMLQAILFASKVGRAGKYCKHCDCPNCSHCPDPDCDECVRIIRMYGLAPELTDSEKLLYEYAGKWMNYRTYDGDENLLRSAKEFIDTAVRERAATYIPLAESVKAHQSKEHVSNDELLQAIGLRGLV
jgi:serine/threonine protein kinase